MGQAPRPSFDLVVIEQSLRALQAAWSSRTHTEPYLVEGLDEEVLENLLSGYALVEQLLSVNTDLFGFGGSAHLLELNNRVLCGTSAQKRNEYRKHLEATQRYFYERIDAGIHDLINWYALHRQQSVWQRAAGLHLRILGAPQLFIEGNARTSTLVMSYLLGREGHPPFVLTPANAAEFAAVSAQIKLLPKNALRNVFKAARLKRRLANLLENQPNLHRTPI